MKSAQGSAEGLEERAKFHLTPPLRAGLRGRVGAPLPYQDGGDNQRGVEQAVGYVGGEDPVVHAEPFRDVPVANLQRQTAQ